MAQVVILTFNTDDRKQVKYLGPYQISWWIAKNGYDTQVLDHLYFMSKEQRINLYNKYISKETKIIGYSPFLMPASGQFFRFGIELAFEILDEVAEMFPWVKVVVGGPIARWVIRTGATSFRTKINAIIDGEGEHAFLDYCDFIFKNKSHVAFTIRGNQWVITNSKKYDIQTCGMKFAKNDFVVPGESLPLELSRGCIFKCAFCQYPHIGKDKDDFNKSMECVKDSLISNYELFGTTDYHITDDTLNSHRERTKQFHKMSKELPFKLNYLGYVRMDLIDIWPEQIDILPDSGLVSAHFGIESLDPLSCKIIGKGWGAKNNKTFLEKLISKWKTDVIINCSLIAGIGTETEKEWQTTHDWFEQSGVHDWFYQPLYLSKYLGLSEFEKNYDKYGYEFITVDGKESDYIWRNKNTNITWNDAVEWCNQRHAECFDIKIPSVWNYTALRNLTFSREEIINSNYIALHNQKMLEERTQKFINAYYNLAINY